MKKTVTAFLKTEAFKAAARYSGNSDPRDFSPDSDGRVARAFGGAYTVDEVRALLADLERVQAAYDAWQPEAGCASCGMLFGRHQPSCAARLECCSVQS